MIRITSGLTKGKRLKFIRSPLVRPMPEKLKGTLFNIIQEKIPGSWFLDGFAGTGSIGLEALSRGAERAVFVDDFPPAVKTLKINIERCAAGEKSLIINKEFNRAVIDLSKAKATFDVIFLDPPYRLLETRNPLKVIRKRGILKKNGLLILRHYFKVSPSLEDFALQREVTSGDDILSFFVPLRPGSMEKDPKTGRETDSHGSSPADQ